MIAGGDHQAARRPGDEAVAKALDFVRQIKKTPIVVNDARFFYCQSLHHSVWQRRRMRMVTEGD